MRLAPDDALKAMSVIGRATVASGDIEALAAELTPDLSHAIDPPVLLKHAPDLGPQCLGPGAQSDSHAGSARFAR